MDKHRILVVDDESGLRRMVTSYLASDGFDVAEAARQVSAAYGMLGVYGHTDRPSHSLAFVGQDGTIKWVRHYSTMFVPAKEFFNDLAGADISR